MSQLREFIGGFDYNRGASQQLTPLAKADVRDQSVAADTDVLTSPISPTNARALFRVWVGFSVDSVLNVTGLSSASLGLNQSVDVGAGNLFAFDVPAVQGDQINFQFESPGTVRRLVVNEIPSEI